MSASTCNCRPDYIHNGLAMYPLCSASPARNRYCQRPPYTALVLNNTTSSKQSPPILPTHLESRIRRPLQRFPIQALSPCHSRRSTTKARVQTVETKRPTREPANRQHRWRRIPTRASGRMGRDAESEEATSARPETAEKQRSKRLEQSAFTSTRAAYDGEGSFTQG